MRKLSIVLAAIFCGYQGIAQVSRVSIDTPIGVYTIKGDYYFDHNNYATAVSNYSKSVNQNPKDIHAILRMAEAHHNLGNDDLAGHWYSKALSVNPDIEEAYILKYISILSKGEKSDELKHWVTIYNDRVSKRSPGGANETHGHETLLLLNNLKSINSGKSDLGAALYNDKLIFSSNRAAEDSGNYYLYRSVLNPNGRHEEPISLHEAINSGASEGPMAIAPKPGRLFFTGTGQSQGDKKALMEVFFCDVPADRSDKVKIDKLVIKNFDYGMGHPAVNSEGTVMYFTSRGPKNDHGFDLYKSEYSGKKWSAPKALGKAINTHGDEMYPALYNDSTLYFASNGHGGLGGFDIYKMNLFAKHARVEPLDAPVNSPADDFGLIFNSNGKEGYLTSNRPGGLGGDDLYKFYVLPVRTTKPVNETVAGTRSKPGALSIYTSKGDEIKLSDDNKGNLAFEFLPGISYTLITDYESYKTGTSKPNSNKTDLPKRNTYTFHIQKLNETIEQKKKSASVKDVHINPGDLITFQLIPNSLRDPEASESKIRFNKSEAAIDYNDTIVFSYVAEAGPEIPGKDDTAPVADLNAGDLSGDAKIADTVSSTEPILAKDTRKENVAPTADAEKVMETGRQQVDSLKDIASIPDVNTKTNNGPKDLKGPMATDSLINTGIAAKENIPVSGTDKNSASTIQQSDALMTKNSLLANSVDKDNALASKGLARDSTQSPGAIALQNKKQTEQDLLAPKIKTVELNAVSENATQTEQPNKLKDIDRVPDENQLSDSLDNAVAKNDQVRDVSTSFSNNDFRYRVQIAASKIEIKDARLKSIYSGPKEIRFFKEDGYYKYFIEETPSYPVARLALKESNVDKAFISAYKGNIKWQLQDAIALQKKELIQQTQSGNENNNVDPTTVNTTKQADTALLTKRYQLSDSVDNDNNAVAKKGLASDPVQFPNAIALQNKKQVEQDQLTRKAETVATGAVSGNAAQTVQQNKQEQINGVPDTYQFSDSLDKGNVVPKTDLFRNSSLSLADNDFHYRVQIAASKIEIKDAQLKNIYSGPEEIRFFEEDGYYKYYIGETHNYQDARQTLKESNVDNAFISAYNGDTKWKLNEAIALQKKQRVQQTQPASENKNTDAIAVNDQVVETVHQPADTTKEVEQVPAVLSTNDGNQDSDRSVAMNPLNSSEGLAEQKKENKQDNKSEKNPVSTVTPSPANVPGTGEKNDFQYRVQIAASKTEIRDAQLKRIYGGPKEIHFFKEDGYVKYYIEQTPNYYIARQTLKESKVDSAFISVYKEDTKWRLQDAIASQYKVPPVRSELAKTDSVIRIVTVNFELDEFVLSASERLHLREEVIDRLKANGAYYAIVNGYTDIRGSEEYNFGLSQERAFFVEQLIVNDDINSERVTTQYFGESQVIKYCPEHENCDESVHQVNRRVEILLLVNKK